MKVAFIGEKEELLIKGNIFNLSKDVRDLGVLVKDDLNWKSRKLQIRKNKELCILFD